MEFHVYVLYSAAHDKIYVGMSTDPEKRLFAHNHLPKGWTRHYRPWKMVYTEVFSDKYSALKREQELKSHQGRDFIRTKILGPR
ncbi:GIY-YIG nuclease family protein [Mangrovibacterium marinum]|uniref:Putative endonuclease n=1 Tax=Mangrovibacterium marinum TaxID=1639118 RepID=A0A2T5C688_9BACT|nr:GIY-YIG nuclease family protein [Mangrovibacterium marinum]PTN10464.1 putative endonuclease [Mangrovibacterium marinum]